MGSPRRLTDLRLAELDAQLGRLDALILSRDGPSSDGRDRASLDRQIKAVRGHLGTLLGAAAVRPGDLRTPQGSNGAPADSDPALPRPTQQDVVG
jgi:hypothetical protein